MGGRSRPITEVLILFIVITLTTGIEFEEVATLREGGVGHPKFFLDEQYLYIGFTGDRFCFVYNRTDFSPHSILNEQGVCIFADSEYLYTLGEYKDEDWDVRIWRKDDFTIAGKLEGHKGYVRGLKVDGDKIYTVSREASPQTVE